MSYLQKTEITKGSSIEIDLGSFQQIATFHSLFYYTKKFVGIDIIPTYLPSIKTILFHNWAILLQLYRFLYSNIYGSYALAGLTFCAIIILVIHGGAF